MCTDESSNSKRKALELITNIFRKKSKDCLKNWSETENDPNLETASMEITLNPNQSKGSSYLNLSSMNQHHHHPPRHHSSLSDYNIPPHSPVSPRVKNIDLDMEALTLSRQDNPIIISKLEAISTSEDFMTMNVTSSNVSSTTELTVEHQLPFHSNNHLSSSNGSTLSPNYYKSPRLGNPLPPTSPIQINLKLSESHSSSSSSMDETNLHQYLIRSPPPQFPTKLSHFVFPLPNSPIKNTIHRHGSFLSPNRSSVNYQNYRSNLGSPSSSSSSSSSSSPNPNPGHSSSTTSPPPPPPLSVTIKSNLPSALKKPFNESFKLRSTNNPSKVTSNERRASSGSFSQLKSLVDLNLNASKSSSNLIGSTYSKELIDNPPQQQSKDEANWNTDSNSREALISTQSCDLVN